MRRYPSLTFFIAGIPVVLLLLFVYVFGGTLGAGLGGPGLPAARPGAAVGRDAYLAYIVPGILLMTVVGAAQGTAISVAMDMTAGHHRPLPDDGDRARRGPRRARHRQRHPGGARDRRSSLVVALLVGFRPTTGPLVLAGGGRAARADGRRRELAVGRRSGW